MAFNGLSVFVLLCGCLTLAIAVYAWRRRSTPGAGVFAAFMGLMSVYILAYSMELASLSVQSMLFWNKIEYIGILLFPILYPVFIYHYTGQQQRIQRWMVVLLLLVPFALLLVKFFDDRLHLIYSSAGVYLGAPFPMLAFTRGPLYWVMAIFNLVAVTIGNVLVWQRWRHASQLFRRQMSIMLGAAMIIYLVYIYYLTGLSIAPGWQYLDLNPFIYMLWGVAISVAIFRFGLFELNPIARDVLIEMLTDGVVVLDAKARVVDVNPEALRLFGWKRAPVGEGVERLMMDWVRLDQLQSLRSMIKLETQIPRLDDLVDYELTISPLQDRHGQRLGYLILMHDISERKEGERKLQELTLVDELTGLTNRRGFRLLADQLISMANRMGLNAVLFYIDLDRLKWINDTLGHAAGDQALQDTAVILKNTFRASDIVVRFGGDEFVVLAIETAENSCAVMMSRLMEQLAAQQKQNRNFELSFSVGSAQYDSTQPRTMEALLKEADQAMYEKKQAKKGLANHRSGFQPDYDLLD